MFGETSNPPSPATAAPAANDSAVTRDRLIPISAAALRCSATASKLLPATVRSKKSHAPTKTITVTPMMKKL